MRCSGYPAESRWLLAAASSRQAAAGALVRRGWRDVRFATWTVRWEPSYAGGDYAAWLARTRVQAFLPPWRSTCCSSWPCKE
jgi:hypothetical protein